MMLVDAMLCGDFNAPCYFLGVARLFSQRFILCTLVMSPPFIIIFIHFSFIFSYSSNSSLSLFVYTSDCRFIEVEGVYRN